MRRWWRPAGWSRLCNRRRLRLVITQEWARAPKTPVPPSGHRRGRVAHGLAQEEGQLTRWRLSELSAGGLQGGQRRRPIQGRTENRRGAARPMGGRGRDKRKVGRRQTAGVLGLLALNHPPPFS